MTPDEHERELDVLAVQVADSLTEHRHPEPVVAALRAALAGLERARDYYATRRDEAATRATGARGRWYIPEAAVSAYQAQRGSPSSWGACERQLIDLSREARGPRAVDRQGREQYRTGRPHSLRMVVDPRPRPEGDLPVMVWAGRGRPPAWAWEPDE